MKNILIIACLMLGSSGFAAEADSTGLEGNNLNLEAVLELFKNSESPEDFEKKLNTESSNVNNLDLNNDGQVDYIRVIDSGDSSAHVLTLQVPVNADESQDVATIELEETSKDVVQIQIVGDEELYGDDYVLLPQSAGNSPVIVNVIFWRPVRFMWGPRYRFWVSPWRYRAYPGWFRPWNRRPWRAYRGGIVVYRGGCRRVYRRSFVRAHTVHYRRTHSVTFVKTHKVAKTTNAKSTNAAKPTKSTNTSTKTSGATSKPASGANTSQGAKTKSVKESGQTQTAPKKAATKEQSAGSKQKTTPQRVNKTQSRKRPGGTTQPNSRKPSGNSANKKGGSTRSSGGRKRP